MLRYLSIILFFSINFIFAQTAKWTVTINSIVEYRKWNLTTKAEEDIRPLSGAQIKASQGSNVVATATSGADGKFAINIPANGTYTVEVSYPDLVSKRFSVNSTGVPEDLQKDETFKPSFGIGGFVLGKPFKGINYSGLSTPLVHVVYDPKVKNFDDDESYTERGLGIAGKIYEDEETLVTNFCNYNKQGDQAMKKPDCPLAKTLYEKAIALIGGENYPVEQLKKVGDCLKEIEESAKKAREAALAKQKADSLAKVAEKEKQAQQQKEKELKIAKEKREKEISDSLKADKEKQITLKAEEEKKNKEKE
ncbi:MAG: carboxypeptidase regulatory-like domain-containing protein, partial [Bacteroidota bacterium]